MFNEKDLLAVNTLRTLSEDQIEAVNHSNPGLPLWAPAVAACWVSCAVSWPALARVEPGRGPRFLGFLPRAVLPAFFSVLRTARSEGRVRGADSPDFSGA